MSLGKIVVSAVGGVTASFASMLCCTGPLVLASLGMSSAGLAGTFRPEYRPFFLIAAGGLLYLAYRALERREQRDCAPDGSCAPKSVKRVKCLLWSITAVALLFATSPRWAPWLLG